FKVHGRTYLAHRWICEQAVGKADLLMHSCDRPACVALQHLSPGTHLLNSVDKVNKGRRKTKITESEADEIRRLYANGGILQSDIATRFGITKSNVSAIITGRSWRQK